MWIPFDFVKKSDFFCDIHGFLDLKMKKPTRYLLTTFVILLISSAAWGQRMWFEFGIAKSISDKFEISLDPEVRFKEGFDLNEYFIEPGMEYEFVKYFSIGASYRVGNNLKKDGSAQWFGRYALDAKSEYDWKRLETQLRIRYTNYDDLIGENSDKVNYLRFKLKLEYDLNGTDFRPYAVYEIYRNLQENEFTKTRWEAGAEYKISKHHAVGAYFRLNDYRDDEDSVKIIGITYKFDF